MPPLDRSTLLILLRAGLLACVGLWPGAARADASSAAWLQDWSPLAGSWRWDASHGIYENTNATSGETICSSGRWSTDFTYRASVRIATDGGRANAGLIFNFADPQDFSEVQLSNSGEALLERTMHGKTKVAATGTYPGAGSKAWAEVEIVRSGNATTVRVNGALVCDHVEQTDLKAGKLGLCSEAGRAMFSHISIMAVPQIEYRSDFGGGAAADWSGTSNWAAMDGSYQHTASAAREVALCTRGTWASDCTYRVSVCLAGKGETGPRTLGVEYNHVDDRNYYELAINPAAGMAEVRKVINGVSSRQATCALNGIREGRWIDLTILRTGDTTSINVDDRRAFTAIAQGELPAGKIGLVARRGEARFADIVVCRGLDPYKRTFPRIGGIYIGGPRDFDQPKVQEALARHDLVILGMYAGFEKGGKTPAELLREIKALNPTLMVGNYTCVMESYWGEYISDRTLAAKLGTEHGPASAPKGSANDWWARNNTGEAVGEFPRTKMTNVTFFVQPDADGLRYPQWYAGYAMKTLHLDQPGFDFLFSDNTYADPTMFQPKPTEPDWDRDGTNDDGGEIVSRNFRLGLATYVMKSRQLGPALFVMGNVGGQHDSHPLANPEFHDLLGGALYEGFMGKPWSDDTWRGWNVMMDGYRNLADNLAYPRILLAGTSGTADGYPVTPALRANFAVPYQFLRYALGSALMEDGYFSYADDAYNIERDKWFDEFDLRLGEAVDPPQRTPYQKGVYRRRFQNGMALVNPRTNPDGTPREAETITIEPGYRRFRGKQAPEVNNGSPVSTLTLSPGDGLILVRS